MITWGDAIETSRQQGYKPLFWSIYMAKKEVQSQQDGEAGDPVQSTMSHTGTATSAASVEANSTLTTAWESVKDLWKGKHRFAFTNLTTEPVRVVLYEDPDALVQRVCVGSLNRCLTDMELEQLPPVAKEPTVGLPRRRLPAIAKELTVGLPGR